MNSANLEHVNLTVSNPVATAELLCELFGWHIRWQGESMIGGYTVHVGKEDSYLALYGQTDSKDNPGSSYATNGGLNHIGVVVDNLAAAEQRIVEAGFETRDHDDYDPGERFYFSAHDGIEFEVVHYPASSANQRSSAHGQ